MPIRRSPSKLTCHPSISPRPRRSGLWHASCSQRAAGGRPPVASTLRRFILRKLLRNREFLERSALALVLPFVAGAVNASGFFIVGAYTSHVTGSVARVGDELAQGHAARAGQAAMLVLVFFLGATLSTALVDRARRLDRAPYAGALMAESATLLLVTLLGLAEPKGVPFLQGLTTALLCVAMGIQNALVTKLSGAVVRTTHLTGIVTDLGIESVRAWEWLRRAAVDRSRASIVGPVLRFRRAPELRRLRLHLAILSSFLGGAFIGPLLYLRQGFASMLMPVAVLLALVAFDSIIGLRAVGLPFDRQASSAETPTAPHPLAPETPP
jgi:uncharacterized membrane protein YoaK (UPF0700 family)